MPTSSFPMQPLLPSPPKRRPCLSEQLQVATLEHKCNCLGKCGVRNAFQHIVVDVVKRYGLLDAMSKFVNSNIVALVVHTAFCNPCTQVSHIALHFASPSVTSTTGRVNTDFCCDRVCLFARPAQIGKDSRNITAKCRRIRITLTGNAVEFSLVHVVAGCKTILPDVVWLQRTTKTT